MTWFIQYEAIPGYGKDFSAGVQSAFVKGMGKPLAPLGKLQDILNPKEEASTIHLPILVIIIEEKSVNKLVLARIILSK